MLFMRMKRYQIGISQLAVAICLWLGDGLAVAADSAAGASRPLDLARQLNEAFASVVESVSPAVVILEVAHRRDRSDPHSGNPLLEMLPPELRKKFEEQFPAPEEGPADREPRFNAGGSGVVIRKNGYILTNSHVVEGAEKIRVRLKNGKEYDSTGVWTDAQSDIAIVKIDAEELPVARLGESSKTRVGEYAIAIGAPFELDYSVTFGHVSAKSRSRVVPFGMGASMDQDFIQTDASINPGNSGGPLVNIEGEVIGINTIIRGMNTGIGFAVPIDLAKVVAEHLIKDGKFTRAWLGLSVVPFHTSELRGVIEGVEQGLVVYQLQPDGPAMKSELRPADIILKIDNEPVATVQQLRMATRAKDIGSELTLDVRRGSERLAIKIKSEPWPGREAEQAKASPPAENKITTSQGVGLTVQTVDADLAEKYGIEKGKGVVVTEVRPGSQASRRRIKPGDVITAVNHHPVGTAKEFKDQLKSAGKNLILNLISDDAMRFEVLKDGGD